MNQNNDAPNSKLNAEAIEAKIIVFTFLIGISNMITLYLSHLEISATKLRIKAIRNKNYDNISYFQCHKNQENNSVRNSLLFDMSEMGKTGPRCCSG